MKSHNKNNKMKIILISIWFVIMMAMSVIAFDMISEPNTIENIIGFFFIVLFIVFSLKTKCLTILLKVKK